jgi:sarcosine oxidase, subunit delta
MLLLPCPWCGPREETEFRYGGQAHLAYPEYPEALSDTEWADFLFMRDNPKGEWAERWMHSAGCRRWFNVVRSTLDHRIGASYPMGSAPPGAGA